LLTVRTVEHVPYDTVYIHIIYICSYLCSLKKTADVPKVVNLCPNSSKHAIAHLFYGTYNPNLERSIAL